MCVCVCVCTCACMCVRVVNAKFRKYVHFKECVSEPGGLCGLGALSIHYYYYLSTSLLCRFVVNGPIVHHLYVFMEKHMPKEKQFSAIKRLIFDRLIFAPPYLLIFLYYVAIVEVLSCLIFVSYVVTCVCVCACVHACVFVCLCLRVCVSICVCTSGLETGQRHTHPP